MTFAVKKEKKDGEFLLEWPVWSGVSICDGFICRPQESAGPASRYQAGEQLGLALELARVNRPRSANKDRHSPLSRARALLHFVSEFGLLGQAPGGNHATAPTERHLEEVKWCLLHASTLDTALTLMGALACGDHDIVDFQLEALREADRTAPGLVVATAGGHTRGSIRTERGQSQESNVWHLCRHLINSNLMGRPQLGDGGRFFIACPALYHLAYAQLARWARRQDFGRCEDCSSYFPRFDRRQRYCPALAGQSESRCAMRDRTRRRRGENPAAGQADDAASFCLLRQDHALPRNAQIEAIRET